MDLSNWIDLLQWPAMAASLLAAWLVASNRKQRRNIGFWVFLGSNVLWTAWGWHDGAWALIALQVALAALNIRGVFKTEQPSSAEAGSTGQAQA
ncbi:MAG TPA: hypothetical protein VFE82_18180 [Ramlibacter sp.]|jgi:hypothetical protein|uniref:hypothetical protein n=1 Tax=Ramlibacter sp. TaxID=1917967 RepID=UPI002D6F0FCF|nr:hypothetical protein [Ramlibacter sp.]HZY20405.1 hypothetical protein [Ramlibacter sp.]